MQDPPDKLVLLEAVRRFLEGDVLEAMPDRGLAFRVRVAANLLRVVSGECRLEEVQDQAELARLRRLLPGVEADQADSKAAIGHLNRTLAERIRSGEWDDDGLREVRRQVMETLQDKLAVVNPRFDTAPEIEGS